MELNIYRGSGGVTCSFHIDERTILQQRLFGENVIHSACESRQILNIAIGDYIVYNGIRYYVNTLPIVTKNSSNNYEYTMTFESQYYDIAKVQMMLDNMSEFDLVGDAEDFIALVVTNLNRVGTGWTKGTCDQTDVSYKLLHFSGENCAEVLVRLSNEFNAEFYFVGKEIRFTDKVGSDMGITVQYRTGLFNFTRNIVSDKNIVTRLYAFGSEKNLDTTYTKTIEGVPNCICKRLMPTPTKNLLGNPGFETGDFTNWDQWGTPDTREIVEWDKELVINGTMEADSDWDPKNVPVICEQSNEQAHSGTYSWKTGTALYDGVGQNISGLIVGKTYKITLWMYISSLVSGSVRIQFDNVTLSNQNTVGSWVIVETTYEYTGTSDLLTIWVNSANSITFYIDDVSIKEISFPSTMPDGTPVPLGTYVYHHIGSGTNDGSSQAIACEANTTYVLSCYMYSVAYTSIRMMTQINGSYPSITAESLSRWERLSLTITTAPGQTSLTVYLGGVGECYWDAVQIERRDVMTPYIDGLVSYLEKNVTNYGIIEFTKIFEEIFPTRTGTISAVDGADIKKFTDNVIDFDLNTYWLDGVAPKIHFQTGDCAGYECEVVSFVWNNPGGDFTIKVSKDRQDFEIPNATLKPAVNDTYKLLDIKMPAAYITAAEDELKTKALAYLDENSSPRVNYTLALDWKYLKTNSISLKIGDFIRVVDTDLGTNVLTRIVYLTQQLMNPYKYTVELSDNYEVQLIQRLYADNLNVVRKIELDKVGDILTHRRNWCTTEELRSVIFDPDDYFDTGNIRPLSIETSMLSVGNKSGQFYLKNVIVEPNYLGSKAKFHASAGYLSHFTIDPAGILTWTLFVNDYTTLTDTTVYYIYAKCHKTDYTNVNNMIVLDSIARQVDADPTYYYFLVGVLHSVVGTIRAISFTYGQTTINGGFITTGTIVVARTEAKCTDPNADQTSANTAYQIQYLPATPSGAGLYCDATHLGYHSGAAWQSYIGSDGKFYFTGDANNYVSWNGTTLTVRGALTADDITAGTLTGRRIQTSPAGNTRAVMDTVNDAIGIIDASDNELCGLVDACPAGNPPGLVAMTTGIGGCVFLFDGTYTTIIRHDGILTPSYYVGANKVVGAQGAAIANATDATSVILRLNDLLAACRTHGLIAT